MKKKDDGYYLFAYGTLRQNVAVPVKNKIKDDMEWIGSSEIKGRMYDIGKYPGALPAGNTKSVIKGEVFKMKKPRKVLKMLDEYEGYDPKHSSRSEYYREKQIVQLPDGRKIEAWVYWYNLPVEGKKRIRHRDYLDYLKKKQPA